MLLKTGHSEVFNTAKQLRGRKTDAQKHAANNKYDDGIADAQEHVAKTGISECKQIWMVK